MSNGEELNKDGLIEVISLSDKVAKHHLEMLANIFISKTCESLGCVVDRITFEQYKSIIINKRDE